MSGGDGIGPRVAQPAPRTYEGHRLRPPGLPPAAPGPSDPRLLAVLLGLLGLSAIAALAASDPARACTPALRGPASAHAPTPRPTPSDSVCVTPEPRPSRGTEPPKPLPWISAEPGQPAVAATPSTLTGSAVTMIGLRLEGIVDLPTAGGTVRTVKFTMDRADVDDVLLRSPGAGRTTRLATRRLTMQGDVTFYATRFTGRLRGVEITLTPNLAVPITSTGPVTFTDPAVDLVFATSDLLVAGPRLTFHLSGP